MPQTLGFLKTVPLLILVVAAYFLVIIGGTANLDRVALSGGLPSGAAWGLRASDLLIAFGLLVLSIEMMKSTRATVATMVDQGLSMLLFALCIVLFIIVPAAGTGTFLLLTLMSLVDVLAGFVITVSANRRDINIERTM